MHLASCFHWQALHQQIYTIHHVHKVEPVPKLSGPHTTDARDQPEAAAITARRRCPDSSAHAAATYAAHAAAARCLSPPRSPAASLVCHRDAHRLAASACRQGRRGCVTPTANHGDADIPCRRCYNDRPATVPDQ
ncbi:hypothetical protein ACLOJK_034832, partial [Asimina triloba]